MKNKIVKTADAVCVTFFIAMVLCALMQVVFRYVLKISVPWTEEAARLLYCIVIFISLILIEAEDSHLKTTYFLEKLPLRVQIVLQAVINVASAAFLACFAYGAILMFESSQSYHYGTMPWLSTSVSYIPAVIAVPFAIYFLIRRIVKYKEIAEHRRSKYNVEEGEVEL